MHRLIAGALGLGLLIASASAAEAGKQIDSVIGPFPSSFVDANGVPQDASCSVVYRRQLPTGGYRENAVCHFLSGAALPSHGIVKHNEKNSPYDFWSDFAFERSGRIELATSWTVTVYSSGRVDAESFYPATPKKPASSGVSKVMQRAP